MIQLNRDISVRVYQVALTVGILCAGLLIGSLIGADLLGWKFGAVMLAAAALLLVAARGKTSYWSLLCIGVLSIAMGHRGIYLDRSTFIVPLEAIFALMALMLLMNAIVRHQALSSRIPFMLLFVTGWAILRAGVSIFTQPHPELVSTWTIPFVFGAVAFYVVEQVVVSEERLVLILRLLMLVSVIISLLGCLEYFFPSAAAALPGFFALPVLVAQDGFKRAYFGFWGYPEAASIVLWGMIIAYEELLRGQDLRWRLISLFVFAISGLAIYISGQRSSWISVILSLFIISINSGIRGWIVALIAAVGMEFVPEDFWVRLATVTTAVLSADITDTSTLSRLTRWQFGLNSIAANPLTGIGFDGYLIHNAVLEIGARIGLIPAVCFVVFLVQLLIRVWKTGLGNAAPRAKRYSLLFLALLIPLFMQLMVETVLQVPPFAAGYWLMIALAWYLPDIVARSASSPSEIGSAVRRGRASLPVGSPQPD